MTEDKTYSSEILAGDILLLAHQGLPDEQETDFDLDFFKRQVGDAYAGILRQQYLDSYKMLRQEGGNFVEIVQFDQQWLKTEVVQVKKDEKSGLFTASLTAKIFTFPFDQSSTGIQQVRSVRFDQCDLVRTRPSFVWKKKYLPTTKNVFWWPEQDILYLTSDCCKELQVLYVPSMDEDIELQQGVADQIKEQVLKLFFAARQGNFPDNTNDSRPPSSPESEANPEKLVRQ